MSNVKKLTRSKDRMIAGVVGGLANYINMDPTILRILYVIVSIASAGFPGLLAYIIMWIIIPDDSSL
jgi:phage shock protein C